VQGIESLLSAKAVDQLDPFKRHSNLNRDLSAIGAGSAVAGLVGGLPMIAEIVRSSANINNGGRTRWANFFHGGLMLVFVVAFPGLIHHIPLAALAAIVIYTGYRLAAPQHFISTYKIGIEQLAIFTTTLVVTLATDLIIGVFTGIVLKLVIHILCGAPLNSLFRSTVKIGHDAGKDSYTLDIHQTAIFSNYLSLKAKLNVLPRGKKVVINFQYAKMVDHSVMEHITHYQHTYNREGGNMILLNLSNMVPISGHSLAARKLGKDAFANSTEVHKTARQIRLAAIARLLHANYTPDYHLMERQPVNLPLFAQRQIRGAENEMTGIIGSTPFRMMDLVLREGDGLVLNEYRTTICLIENLPLQLPVFQVAPEELLDRFFKTSEKADVDFESHPDFSKRYLLSGPDPQAIRAFFSDELLELFEQAPERFSVECDGETMICLLRNQPINPDEWVLIYEFIGKLLYSVRATPALYSQELHI